MTVLRWLGCGLLYSSLIVASAVWPLPTVGAGLTLTLVLVGLWILFARPVPVAHMTETAALSILVLGIMFGAICGGLGLYWAAQAFGGWQWVEIERGARMVQRQQPECWFRAAAVALAFLGSARWFFRWFRAIDTRPDAPGSVERLEDSLTELLFLLKWPLIVGVIWWGERGIYNASASSNGRLEGFGVAWFWLLSFIYAPIVWFFIWAFFEEKEMKHWKQKMAKAKYFSETIIAAENSPDYITGKSKLPLPRYENKPHPTIERSGLLDGSDKSAIPLGFSYADELLYDDGETHLITIGPTGTGKNISSQTPALCTYRGSAFVIDPKGQLAAITTWARQEMGQETANINPFNVLGLPTACYNPLQFLDPASLRFDSDCLRIASGLVFGQTVEKGGVDHFESSALALVNLLIQWVTTFGGSTEIEPHPKDLISVYEILYALGDASLRKMFFTQMRAKGTTNFQTLSARWLSENKEVTDCISTAQNHLSFMGDAGIRRILRNTSSARDISFADLKKQSLTVYLLLPPELLDTHGRFLRLLVMSALGELFNEQTNPKYRVLFMLDEFAQLGRMALIESTASIVRDYKVRLWLILQNLPRFQDIYGEKGAESFLSSASTVQWFTPSDQITAEYISKRSGEMFERFSTTAESVNTPAAGGGPSTGSSTTFNERKRFVLRPQDVYALPKKTGQVLIRSGLDTVIMATRKPYWDTCAELVQPDPYHMNPTERAAWDAWVSSGQSIFETSTQLRRNIQAVS